MGLGTLGLAKPAESVRQALSFGCQLLDVAEHYGNLREVGAGLKGAATKPYIVVKLSGMPCGELAVVRARLQAVLQQLGAERAELCLMHWPGLCGWDPADMVPLESPAAFRDKASSWEQFCEHVAAAWANLMSLREEGLVGEVGTSNFYPEHLKELAARCGGAKPFANEIFIDITNQEWEFVEDMQRQGIRVLAYRPVAYRPFPPELATVSKELASLPGGGPSGQAVVLGWLLQRGIWPLVKSDDGAHCQDNMTSPPLVAKALGAEHLQLLKQCDAGTRGSQDWFARIWKLHASGGAPAYTEEDVQTLVSMGVEEEKARAALEASGGDVNAALDVAFGGE